MSILFSTSPRAIPDNEIRILHVNEYELISCVVDKAIIVSCTVICTVVSKRKQYKGCHQTSRCIALFSCLENMRYKQL